MSRPSSSDRQVPAVIAALQNLRPSGEKSFEEFVARLLSSVSGERIRRCKAGSQGGVDAIAETPFALESKRYATQLSTRDLVGGLTEAAGTYPDLQLWVLAATCEVAAQTREAVVDAGLRQGIAVLILDTLACDPDLPGVDSLAALAATDVATTMEVLADPTWRAQGRKPNLVAIDAALQGITRLASFAAWKERLRRNLRDLPTWHRLVRLQNERLLSLILTDAENAFGLPYDASSAVSRTVEAELTLWAQSSIASQAAEIAVVTGHGFDGKTTLVYRWLSDNLPTLPIPVFFFPSRLVQSVHGDVKGLVLRDAGEALGRFECHASLMIERQRSREDGGAWCLMILDGANEYVADPQARSSAVLWALPPNSCSLATEREVATANVESTKHRPSALLVTCRTHDFEEDSKWLGPRPQRRVKLGPYDDREFADALARRKLGPSDVAGLSESATTMIRHPRYLDLVLRHREKLGQFSAITADVLHYLDASDKVPSPARLNPDAFKAFLRGLAESWKDQRRLNYSALRNHVSEVTENVDASIATLISEGVLTREADSFVPNRERLALGMGLFIRDSLLSVPEESQAEKLRDILEPHPDDDEKVRWLRAAVTTSVLTGDASTSPGMFERLLTTWLASRSFSKHDLDDVKSLSSFLLEPLLRIISADSIDSSVLLLAQAVIETEMPRQEDVIAAAIRRWFRLVPMDTFFHGEEEARKEVERVTQAASEGSLRDLDLRRTAPDAGKSVRTRHSLGLSVANAHNSVLDPIDLLALVAARGITHWNLNDGERFAVREMLANAPRSWFENEVTSWEAKPEALRLTLLRDLIRYSERADLIDLESRLPAPEANGWPEAMRRAELKSLDATPDAKETLSAAERAAELAVDPNCPRPPRAWRLRLAKAASERFGDSPNLHSSRGRTLDDLDLENLEPALAAWAPEAGARIVRSFLEDIPRRIAAGEESWSWALDENATLLTHVDRRAVLELILTTPAKESGFQHALRRGYLCVMTAEPPSERLRLLLDHPFTDFEWTEFYQVLALAGDESLRRQTARVVREEHDPRRLKRARYFLASQGGWEATPDDLERLVADLSRRDSDAESQDATRTLLRYSRIDSKTSASTLGPLVHVAGSLSEEAWQYEAFLHTQRNPGAHGAEWMGRARSARVTAQHNGARGDDDDLIVAEGIQRLSARIRNRLHGGALGRSDQFPEGIADAISDSAFDGWVDELLEWRGKRVRLETGVLIPVVKHALRTGHPAAREVWQLAYPFQRSRISFNERIVVQGLDWTLVAIHDPAIDDGLACELLRDLVSDCRSNSELISIAMGARLESLVRLTTVVNELLDDGNDTRRARARFIAGWMPENALLRKRLAVPDRSRWVERTGRGAIHRLDREKRAREWLRRFLAEKRRTHRWAAGRLFLACSDASTPFWAGNIIQDSQAPSSRRAEGVLLLRRIRKKVDDSKLRDSFLGFSVRGLSEAISPWHKPIRWDDIDVTPEETT